MNTAQKFKFSEWLWSKTGLTLIAFLAIAAFFLIAEHTAHLFGVLPYVLLFLCPLLHFFMHRGHGDPAGHADHVTDGENK
jgi:hypothetical protein